MIVEFHEVYILFHLSKTAVSMAKSDKRDTTGLSVDVILKVYDVLWTFC